MIFMPKTVSLKRNWHF